MSTRPPEHVTDAPVKVVDGVECTTRAGIARLAGWPAGNNVNVRARTDPDFPKPIGGPEVRGRTSWYPFAGDTGVDRYLAILAERAQAKKPQPVEDGDPDDLLDPDETAAALHIEPATLRSYVRYSKPFWDGEQTGRPLLPPPDHEEQRENRLGAYTHRQWYRRTLAAHQAQRPGPGTGAGRRRKSAAPA